MILRLTKSIRLYLSRPVWVEIIGKPQLELSLKKHNGTILMPPLPEGYSLRTLLAGDEEKLCKLYSAAGFQFSLSQLSGILANCLPDGCFVIEHKITGELVATMMARHHSSDDYPFGGRIDWLATSPEHRKKGLGNICASAATKRLIQSGYSNIWVTTDDFRPGAIKIFTSIGFQPVINSETESRWKEIYQKLNLS